MAFQSRDLHPREGDRGVDAPGRMTSKERPMPVISTVHPDIGDIAEQVDNSRRLALVEGQPPVEPQSVDQVAREKAEGWIADLGEDLTRLELRLSTLGGFFEGTLGASLIDALGIRATEMRQQLPALRQAARDMESGS